MKGIIGKKIGMTQTFSEKGEVQPVTLVQAGPCVITQIKTKSNDGYNAIQIGYQDNKAKLSKAEKGHLEKLGIPTQINLPGIGQNLSDHPINFLKASVKDIDHLDTQKPCLQVGLRYTASESDIEDDMLMWMNSYSLSTDYREVETMTPQGNLQSQNIDGIQIAVSVYLATSKGSIQLNSSDPEDSPDIFLNLLDTEKDVERMAEGIKIAKDLMESKPMRPIVQNVTSPTDYILNSRESFHHWLRTNTVTGHHLTGTCRMGSDTDEMSVVDSNGKVKGLNNLYIADASIMPESVRANTNATTMMIGEKISAYLETNH